MCFVFVLHCSTYEDVVLWAFSDDEKDDSRGFGPSERGSWVMVLVVGGM